MTNPSERPARIAILSPTDLMGYVPSGIDSFVRGVMTWAPSDLSYTLFGATSDPVARPLGKEVVSTLGSRQVQYTPIVSVDPTGSRKLWPLTARYLWALRAHLKRGVLDGFDVLDFHRVEPIGLFLRDARPKNVVIHLDMAALRDAKSDIMWRHAPWLYEALERRLFRGLDRIFCVRQSAVDRYVKADPSLAHRFCFIPTWVDTTTFTPTTPSGESRELLRRIAFKELGLPAATKLLISVGRLDHQKDPLLLIESLRTVLLSEPNVHLAMVGDGILRTKVAGACASTDLRGRVTMFGARPAVEIARLLRVSDVFVLSSSYEGMPIALLEALATGVPVVSTDVGEVRRVIREGVNGRIAAQRTPQALASAICQVLTDADNLRGYPCTQSVEPFRPESVLARIYENHRRQTGKLTA